MKENFFIVGDGCYGGVARLKSVVDKLKTKSKNVVFVEAGNFYQPHCVYNLSLVTKMANILDINAMVRNHCNKMQEHMEMIFV